MSPQIIFKPPCIFGFEPWCPAFKAKCPESVIETKDIGRCWNYLTTHTYFPFEQLTGKRVWHVFMIDCKLKSGPSEFSSLIPLPIRLEVKKDGKWVPVKTFDVHAHKGEPEPFSAVVNADITDVRFVAEEGCFVDYSEIEVYGYPVE